MSVQEQIDKEVAENTIVVYGKGTKEAPLCGFTYETVEFFNKYGYPFIVVNALADPEKREALSTMTNWPTLPKVFIKGKFYGDTDVLGPMEESGELKTVLSEAFAGQPEPAPVIKLH